ncbi:hypothetical protein C1646_776303 [Rhizophagus diaphanus]|nr:hypothetical protein C1646_776303 [Rhizophagus diaphanus] [Rhizophagus sp. MUCL 43196]
MAGIATRYVTENEFNTEMSIEELSKHAPALDILLMDKLTAGWKKGGALPNTLDTPDITQEAELDTVNIYQILLKETIRDLAQHIILDNLSKVEVNLKASEKIISATLISDITHSVNKIQKECSKQCEDERINYLDHFSLESVKERLNMYEVPGLHALADLKRKVNLLEAKLDDLDECVDRKTVIDLIQEKVPLLIGKKGKTLCCSFYSSESSEDSDLDEIIEGSHRYQVREKMDVPHKQRRKASKKVFVDCVVEENIPIETTIDTGANVNCISQKHICELGIIYHNKRKTLFNLITTCNHAGSWSYNTAISPGHIVSVITEEDVKCLGI